ncbi:hypothetical protein MTR_5g006910 [Medicago truncatula]|uniref:Uncharacterized protein n=1 Tax=Medicago truncatula TaxID=3880 RepID=G7K517_MEDTR|nr:hypothetical protein MTR_5g006910 [Medicago truncatula]
MNTKLDAMYYSMGKPNMFRINVDVTLSDLKDQSDWINGRLNHEDTRRMNNVEYRRLLTHMDMFGSPK